MARLLRDRRRLCGLAGVGALLFLAVLAWLLGLPWLDAFFTPTLRRQAVVWLLVGLEAGYVIVVISAAIGACVFGGLLARARGDARIRLTAARAMLLSIASLLALMLAEGAAAVWRASMQHAPPLVAVEPELSDQAGESAPAREIVLTVLGESSALGTPYERWLSIGQIVAWQLGRAVPGLSFRVDLLARNGAVLEHQYRALANLRRRPDALIVYCGHNEFYSGIPWWRRAEYYVDDRFSLLWGLDEWTARISPLCWLIRTTADSYRVAIMPAANAPAPLVDVPVYDPAAIGSRVADFRRRLDAIAAYGQRIGAVTVLVVPPANDAGFAPNRSFLPAATQRGQREAFAREFWVARRAEDHEPAKAIKLYRELLVRQPGFAETHYRLGQLLVAAGEWQEAYKQFVAARDLDGYPMRCLTPFQEAYRQVAARHDCILVDGQALFHAIGPHGLLDDHLFHDAMHPSLGGHIALAQAILQALRSRGAFGWSASTPALVIDPAECAAHFHLEQQNWKRICERGAMFYYATTPLRYDGSDRLAKRRAFEAAAMRIAAGFAPEALGLPNVGVPARAAIQPASATPPIVGAGGPPNSL